MLRRKRVAGTRAPFDLLPSASPDGEGEPGEIWLERAHLTDAEVLDLAADPSIAALAPTMPTALNARRDLQPASELAVSWGLAAVHADSSPLDGSGVVVALLDTGIEAKHPAFAGVQLVERDFTMTDHGDAHGHGTHCAGIIFGRDVGGVRIGVARGVTRALIGKVLSASGDGRSDWAQEAILWAFREGARVIAMPFALDFERAVADFMAEGLPRHAATQRALECYRANVRALDTLIALVRARPMLAPGALMVVAAGDDSMRDARPPQVAFRVAASPPATVTGTLAVGAVARHPAGLIVAPFSNLYPQLCAPGVDVPSAHPGGGLALRSGTSAATAHVAGVAALWCQHLGERSQAAAVISQMLQSCRTGVFATVPHTADTGAGLVTAPRG